MFRHLWHHWLYALALTCAGVLIGSLALVSTPAHAQNRTRQANTPLSRARQALQADLGLDNPLDFRGGERSRGQLLAPSGPGNPAGTLKPRPGPSCWNVVSSPNPSPDFDQLYGVGAVSPKDVWAVGYDDNGLDGALQTLIEHWDGRSWSVVPSPNPGLIDDELAAVTAIAPNNVWAVGISYDGTRYQTLTEHWDGTAWSIIPSPNPGDANNYLNGVAATSRNDVWAVGTYRIVGGPLATLTEHWNGTSWTVVSSPSPGTDRNILTGVTASGPNDVWAVGYDRDLTGFPGRTLTERWNGRNWSVVTSPNGGPEGNRLLSVSASNPNDIWAAGFYCTGCGTGDEIDYSLIEHWDGFAWSMMTHSGPGPLGVLAINPNDAWAVGSISNDGGNTYIDLVSHWDGTTWNDVEITSPGAYDNDLRSLAAIGPNDVWAVGDYDNGSAEQTQVQHFTGPCK